MLRQCIFYILICFFGASGREFNFKSNVQFLKSNTGETNYRLLDTVYPHTMHIDLDIYLDESRFNGLVTMDIEVRDINLTQIAFHQKVKSIEWFNFVTADNSAVNLNLTHPFTTDDYYELILINLAAPINPGYYNITIGYTGVINENPYDGALYKGYYFKDNQEIAYATTQFAPFYARRVFPCFDEPQFKSRFMIAVTRDSRLNPTYSNMEINPTLTTVDANRIREVFYPSPTMSAYLVAIHVSDFEHTEMTSTKARPFRIISRPGVLEQHSWAADIGVKATNELDDYFGIRYHEMGQGIVMKNDHIALPDFTFGALENWGLVGYREAFLLYDKNNTNLLSKIYIATIVAHELTHKWFGNLVTTLWWSDIWLNESFPTFFAYFAIHSIQPELELDNQFIVDYLHRALDSDANPGVNPMSWQEVASNSTIGAHFSITSYQKGASVLKMMEHFVGTRNFRLALRYYLRDNAYNNTAPANMYNALNRAVSEDIQFIRRYPDIDIISVFESWVKNPGSPVVKVDIDTETGSITVSQQRYVISGTRPNYTWYIPLTWTHEGAINFNDTRPTSFLFERSKIIGNVPRDHWVIFNIAQSGFYRVNYDENNWQRIGNELKNSSRQRIHKMNRAQITNDLLYFIRSGDVNKTIALNVLEFLKDETDYFVWNSAIVQLEFILRRLEHLPLGYTEFSAYILDLLKNVIQSLGYEDRPSDSTSDILNRMQIMNFACNLGHTGCVEEALEKWKAYRANEDILIPPNYRRYVYCVGLREGNASDYEFLLRKYETSENTADMAVMLRALGCTKDEASFNNYLEQSIVNRKIRVHDRTNLINFALQGNREIQPLLLDFLFRNFTEIRDTYGNPDSLRASLISIAGFLTKFSEIQRFQTWIYNNQVPLGESFASGVAAVSIAQSNLEWGNANAREIYDYLLARSGAKVFIASIVLVLMSSLLQILLSFVLVN